MVEGFFIDIFFTPFDFRRPPRSLRETPPPPARSAQVMITSGFELDFAKNDSFGHTCPKDFMI